LERLASVAVREGSLVELEPPPPGSVEVLGGWNEEFVLDTLRVFSRVGMPSRWLFPPSWAVSEAASFNLLYDGFLGIPVDVAACIRRGEFDDAMLAVLLSELEKPESRDVECDCVPSVPESSSTSLCLSSKLGTVRMVEFMRFGVRGDKEEVDAGGTALPLVSLVAVRAIAEFIVPSDAGVRVDRGEGRSCNDLDDALLGVDLVGAVAGVSVGGATVTGERSLTAHC
jgi:hypothetical protein